MNRIGSYTILQKLAEGGMGAVYIGIQETLGRKVAIKVLPAYLKEFEEFVERFEREAKIVAQLNHPNIIQMIDRGQWEGNYYFVMEFVDGKSLADLIKQKKTLAWSEAVKILCQVCEGLQCAHERKVVHRDIKPGNIMLDEHGTAKLTDFGISCMKDGQTRITRTMASMGTPDYMAPEQLTDVKTADGRADIYSLGIVLHELITGKTPKGVFDPPSVAVPGTPKSIDRILQRCIQQNREDRYQTVEELHRALKRSLQGPSFRKPLLGVAAMLFGLVALAAGWSLRSREDVAIPRVSSPQLPDAIEAPRTEPMVRPTLPVSSPTPTKTPETSTPVSDSPVPSSPARRTPETSTPVSDRDYLHPKILQAENEILCLQGGSLSKATTLIEEAMKDDLSPRDRAEAHFLLGEIAADRPDPNTAYKEYDACIQADPKGERVCLARMKKGLIQIAMANKFDEGLETLRDLFEECDLSQAEIVPFLMQEAKNRLPSSSMEALSSGIRGQVQGLTRGVGKVVGGVVKPDRSQEIERACALLRFVADYCRQAAEREEALFDLGRAHYLLRQTDKSLQASLELLSDYPGTDYPVELEMGSIYEELREKDKAMESYRSFLRRKPDSPHAERARKGIENLQQN